MVDADFVLIDQLKEVGYKISARLPVKNQKQTVWGSSMGSNGRLKNGRFGKGNALPLAMALQLAIRMPEGTAHQRGTPTR